MLLTLLQAKLHRVRVTRADLHYEGSCGIDEALLERSGMREFQHIDIWNVNNGERFSTYIIKSQTPGEICLNGAAARKVQVGDHVIICTFVQCTPEEASRLQPVVVLVDENNKPIGRP